MDVTDYSRERHANILSRNVSHNPERSENNSVRTAAKYKYAIGQPFENSCQQYENDVLKAYSIDPVATKKRNGFVLCKGEDAGRNNKSMTKKFHNRLAIEHPLDSCSVATEQLELGTQYELTVLKAYGILPVQLFWKPSVEFFLPMATFQSTVSLIEYMAFDERSRYQTLWSSKL